MAANVYQILVYNEPQQSEWQWCQSQVESLIASDDFKAAWSHVKISTPFLGGVSGAWLTGRRYDEKHPVSFQPYPYGDVKAGVNSLGYDVKKNEPVPANESVLEGMVTFVQNKVKGSINVLCSPESGSTPHSSQCSFLTVLFFSEGGTTPAQEIG